MSIENKTDLPDFGTPVSSADFEKYPVALTIASAEAKTCEQYETLFSSAARRLADEKDFGGFQLFRLLSAVCSLMPQFGNTKRPFRPKIIDYVNKCSSPGAEHFSPDHCAAFKEGLLKIGDDELRARLADVVAIQKFDHLVVEIAAEAYLKSALQLVSPEHWYPCVERLRRAFWLSSRLGINEAIHKEVLSETKRLIDENHAKEKGLFTAHLISLLTTFDSASASNYLETARSLANQGRSNAQWHVSRCYFEVLQHIYRVSKPPQEDKSMATAAEIAETFALEAEKAEKATPASIW